jgi:hypothetical protein
MIYGDSVSITYLCPLAGNANSNTPSLLIINSRGDVVVRTVKACDIAPVDCNIVVLLLLASSTDDVDDEEEEEDGDHSIASWFKLDRSDAVPYATAPAPTMPTLNESDAIDDEEVSSLMSAVV